MTSALLVLALLGQAEHRISRTAKATYQDFVKKCDDAARIAESNPADAVKALDECITTTKIDKRECRLKFEIQSGTYGAAVDFFPHHWRGRARVKLAESAGKDEKIKLLESAIEDLQKSVDAGVKASEAHLETAQKLLEEAKRGGAAVDPLPAFERGLDDLLGAAKFVDAKKYVETKGDFLSAEKRAEYAKRIEDKCREQLKWSTDQFLDHVQALSTPNDVMRLSPAGFDRDFRLPAADTLVVTTPAFAWCVKARDAFAAMRAKKDALEALFDAAVEAVPLDEKGENPWFAAMERLAWAVVEDELRRRTDEAQAASADQRLKLRTEVEGLSKRWTAFQERLRKAAESRADFAATIPRRDPAAYLARFPVDATGLDKIVAALETSVHAEDPAKELAKVEEELRKIDRGRLTLESRRRVASYRVVAASLRGFLDGKSVDQLASDLRDVSDELRSAGGPVDDLKRYGQKVLQVFERLR